MHCALKPRAQRKDQLTTSYCISQHPTSGPVVRTTQARAHVPGPYPLYYTMPCSAETHEPIKDVMVMSATSAKASFNQETEDFQLEIGVPYGAGHVNRLCEGIDCYGNMSAGLPSGGAAAMSMFLPMYVPFHMGNFRMASTLSKKEIDLRFGRIGRTTVDNGLRGLVEKGDPVFILEVLLKDSEKLNPETMVPTRHSHANFDERYRHADYRCATVHTCRWLSRPRLLSLLPR
jgi:hypothetical protein